MSKTTMYKYFPNSDEIFRAVMEAEAERFEAGVPTETDSAAELRTVLSLYGENLLGFLNDPEIIQFDRLMHEEARTHPDVAKMFYEAAYGRAHVRLTHLIQNALEKELLTSDLNGEELAEQLLGMWESLRFVKACLGLSKRPYSNPKAWSEKCVATLLDGLNSR